ncbi:MAG TPA: hypothetical protein VFU06_15015 [Longimicrobiales bacterium]|nr:hypothetical protein [Longimicrobiales bacterium]
MRRCRAQLALVLAVALLVGGCARLFDHYDVGPSGLARADERLRHLIADPAATQALASLLDERDAFPSDPLLARMYGGIVAYHAGDYGRSAAMLDSATLLIDERTTKSASRTALSIISTDKVMPYQAGDSERLLLHYYAALAWLRLGSAEDAAVEVRRMALLLEEHPPGNDAGRRLHAAMRHASAAIFAMAGESADADVAWRNARTLLGDSVQDARLPRPDPDSVDVYLFIDRGFVGHRAEQSISLWLPGDEVGRLRSDDDEGRAGLATVIAARITAAADEPGNDGYRPLQVAAPAGNADAMLADTMSEDSCASPCADPADGTTVVAHDSGSAILAAESARPGRASGTRGRAQRDSERDMPYLMRIAWPVFRELSPPLGSVRVLTDSVSAHTPLVRASVSSAVAEDLRADRPMLVARTVARAAAKLAITRGIEDEIREKDDGAAELFAMLGNVAFAVTEQADTRSWTLLPAAVEIVRVRVPAGGGDLRIEVAGRDVTRTVDAPGGSIRIEHVRLH